MNNRDLFFKNYRQLSDIENFSFIIDSPAIAGVEMPFTLPDGSPVNIGAWVMACYQCFNYRFPSHAGLDIRLVQGRPNTSFPGMFTAITEDGRRITRFIPQFLNVLKSMMATFPSRGDEMSFAAAMSVIEHHVPQLGVISA
jgi:hypothetical protein